MITRRDEGNCQRGQRACSSCDSALPAETRSRAYLEGKEGTMANESVRSSLGGR